MVRRFKIKSPNKYAELMNEINSDEILEGFLGYGLFADKIPNFLTSEYFYEWYITNLKPAFENKGKDYVRYESMRNINIPRLLAIPNPFSYANLCKELSDNWEKIRTKLLDNNKDQKFKISRIHIRKMKDKKHLFEMNYNNIIKDGNPEQKIIIGKQFCVETDISNCFPSIYSHSVPWALVGKPTAKKNKDNYTEWYVKLDKVIRNTKNEETNGILIGPHSSHLISETILTTVDKTLSEKKYEFVRHVDDYKCYVSTYEEAEKFLIDLSAELKNYELYLNNKKTQISQLPLASVDSWVNRLNSFDLGTKRTVDDKLVLEHRRLRALLDMAIELMVKENNSAIMNYTFKIIATKYLDYHSFKYYIDYVHHLLLLYPYLTNIIDEQVFVPFEVENSRIRIISNDLYRVGIKKHLYDACSYSVFWAIKYNFKLNTNILNAAIDSNDCIFMTLGYLYSKKFKDSSSIKEYKRKAIELSVLDFDQKWIFLYTVLPEPKLIGDYKMIKKYKVSFIKKAYR